LINVEIGRSICGETSHQHQQQNSLFHSYFFR
jgi:hypothetical protein